MFRNLDLKQVYNSNYDDIPKEFYNPVLKSAVSFDRTSAYFSAKALAKYSEGLEYFGNNGECSYRLIISCEVSQSDFEEIRDGYRLKEQITNEMLNRLDENLEEREEMHISNLAYFISQGVVDIKIAFTTSGLFHEKCGILTDAEGNIICFYGSNNETEAALERNSESFSLTCSWLDSSGFYLGGINQSKEHFANLWNNNVDGLEVRRAEDVIIKKIISHNKGNVIVEQELLRKNAVILDYDNGLLLQINTDSIEWFINKGFYRRRLLHKVERIYNNTIIFKSDLTYLDFIKIDSILKNYIPPLGYEYLSTKRLQNYIDERNLYIKERAALGIELNTAATRLQVKYLKFMDVVNSQFERTLREKQMRDAFYMCAMKKSCNFSVPGSGKTSSALAVFAYLKHFDLVDKVIVIGPKNSFAPWKEEFCACFGQKMVLNCFDIQNPSYLNNNNRRNALKYDSCNCNLFLFNYECIGCYVDEIKNILSQKSLLVFDEVHKVKAIDGQRATSALEIARFSKFTIAMTGTPIPNSYLDLYNLLHILYYDEYNDFFGLDTSYLKNPSPTDIGYINEVIQPFFCRTTKEELQVPKANTDIIKQIEVTEAEKRIFEIIKKQYKNNQLALFIRILQLETNPKLLLNAVEMKDFSNVLDVDGNIDEIDYVDYEIEMKELINNIDITSKKKACIELVKSLVESGKTVIVWSIFVDSIVSIQNKLEDIGIRAKCVYGQIPLENRELILNSFNNREFEVLITNPQTLAEAVSLHEICHDAIYFEYSYNLVHLLQSKDRIHRLGLNEGQYTQYYYLQDNFNGYSIDKEIYDRLLHKEEVMLKAIDNNELEPVYTPEEDLKIIFKKLYL